MTDFIIISISFVVLCFTFISPKRGSCLIWYILFTYPHSYWFNRAILPWNIGVDDLFILSLFFVVLIRRNIFGGIPIRFGYAFWMLVSIFLIWAISNYNGYSYAADYRAPFYIKEVLRMAVDCSLFYSILHCIDDEEDFKRQFTAFSYAAAIGGTLVVLSYFFPYQTEIFAQPQAIWKGQIEAETRASGALGNANMAACILVCCLIFIVTTIRLKKKTVVKAFYYSMVFIILLGIMVTRSRAGLLALGGSFILMAVFSHQNRKLAILVLIAGTIVAFAATDIAELYMERIKEAYDPTTGHFGGNVYGRFSTWYRYFETSTGKTLLFGQGQVQGHARTSGETHSTYVSFIAVYGFGSVLWAVLGFLIFIKKVRVLKKSHNEILSTVSAGCMWSLVAWGIFAFTADSISSTFTRYLLLYWIVLIDRSYAINTEQQYWLEPGEELESYMTLEQTMESY